MPATNQGVGNSRAEKLAAIVNSRKEEIDRELKDGGVAEGIAALEPADKRETTQVTVELTMPEGTDAAEWGKLTQEAKQALVEAEEDRKRVEAEAAAGETPEAKAAREAKEEADRKAAEEAAAQAAAAAAAAGPKKMKLKVDGKEVEVDESEVLEAGRRTLQKETAADQRLEQASKTAAEATRLYNEAQNLIRAAAQGRAAEQDTGVRPSAKDGKPPVLTDEELTKTVKAIQYGSEAEAKEALQNLVSKAATSGQSEDLTLAQVGEMLDFRDARQWAETEFKDVLGDANLRKLFLTKEREKRATGDARPYRELYAEIGTEVRDWRKSLAPAPANPSSGGSRAEVRERKTTLVPVPSAAARLPAPTQPKEPTPTETISKMRAARHQS